MGPRTASSRRENSQKPQQRSTAASWGRRATSAAAPGTTKPTGHTGQNKPMGNFLQKAPAARPASPPHNYALASTPLEELADSAHEQSMSAHTMQSTLRLLIVGQAPIEPWKLVGEPPRGVSRATSLRSLTSMRLTPCPVALPRSWLASAAAGVTICVKIKILRRVRHRRVACSMAWRCRFLIHTG